MSFPLGIHSDNIVRDLKPTMSPRSEIESLRFRKIWVSEASDRYKNRFWRCLHSIAHKTAADRAEHDFDPAPRVRVIPPSFCSCNRHVFLGVDGTVCEGTSREFLAIKAAADVDVEGLRLCCYGEVVALATGLAFLGSLLFHFALLLR